MKLGCSSDELHNQTQHLSDDEWDDYESSPTIDKGVLDDQQLDDATKKLRQEGNSNDATGPLEEFRPDVHINVHYVRAYYCGPQPGSSQLTRVSEKAHIMQWRGEHFKCRVGFTIEESMPKSDWTIGLAQACDAITLDNTFEHGGHYSWEFQPLKSGIHKMVNDSNGSQWPFYSHKSSMLDIRSGIRNRPSFHELRFSDYFYPTMHWQVKSAGYEYRLSKVVRRQKFKVWFLIIKRGSAHAKDGYYSRYMHFRPTMDEVIVMKSMQWRYNLQLNFDCLKPLGSRCTGILDEQEEQPIVFDTIDNIPTSALVAPNCNSCQSLIFYPTSRDHPLILKKAPEDVIVPWNQWRSSMIGGLGRDKITGFDEPKPPPIIHEAYPGDPHLLTKKIKVRLTPMDPPPEKTAEATFSTCGTFLPQ